MSLNQIKPQSSKEEVMQTIASHLLDLGLKIADQDFGRPWGGFFVIEESQLRQFKQLYFEEIPFSVEQLKMKLSPKILVVSPDARLSWQYHHRRAELWKLIFGEAGIVRSDSDQQAPLQSMVIGEAISLRQGERHRLVGLKNWGIVAEIWMHTDPENPSDESDIVRLSDDYSRK